jgi:hypothetical protein
MSDLFDIAIEDLTEVGEVAVYNGSTPSAMRLFFDGKKYLAIGINDVIKAKGNGYRAIENTPILNAMIRNVVIAFLEKEYGPMKIWGIKCRKREHVIPRMLYMFALKYSTNWSLNQIGASLLNPLNHATVIHADKCIRTFIELNDPLIVRVLNDLCEQLNPHDNERLTRVVARYTRSNGMTSAKERKEINRNLLNS